MRRAWRTASLLAVEIPLAVRRTACSSRRMDVGPQGVVLIGSAACEPTRSAPSTDSPEQVERHGLKGGGIAKVLGITPQYWSSVTVGKFLFPRELLEKTLDLLEFDDDDRGELLGLREIAKERAPLAAYSALFGESLIRLYGLEAGAHAVRTFENSVVPGLLQTEDYARALMRSTAATRPTEAEQRVRARLDRQRRLDPPDPVAALRGHRSGRVDVPGWRSAGAPTAAAAPS